MKWLEERGDGTDYFSWSTTQMWIDDEWVGNGVTFC